MSWSRSSKFGLVVILLLVSLATVGVASAVSVQEQAPDEAEVGQPVNVSVELTDLYEEESSWQIYGQTELQDAEWTIELHRNGELVDTRTATGEQPDPVQLEENGSDAPDRVVVEIAGTAPEVSNYSYADPATFLAGEVVQYLGGSDPPRLSQQYVHHYTAGDPGSQSARTALDDASAAIESAGQDADVSQAESTFQDAVAAYDSGDFGEAASLAADAQSQVPESGGDGNGSASDDGSSDGSTGDGSGGDSGDGNATAGGGDGGSDGGLLGVLLYVVLGLLVLGAVGGGAYWYLQRDQGPNRDPLG